MQAVPFTFCELQEQDFPQNNDTVVIFFGK